MLDIKLNTKDRSIELEVMLKGESEPLNIKIEKYEIVEEGGTNYIKITKLATSREWLNIASDNFLSGKKFKLPDEAAKVLTMLA